MPILLCPSRSLATFTCTPDASMWVAWVCRRSWNRMRGRALAGDRLLPLVGEAIRLDAVAGRGGADQRFVDGPYAEPKQFLCLL